MNKNIYIFAILLLAIISASIYFAINREVEVSGDNLMAKVLESNKSSATSWEYYREDEKVICFKYEKPFIYERYCAPKTDVEFAKPEVRKIPSYIKKGDVALRENRYVGASRIVF